MNSFFCNSYLPSTKSKEDHGFHPIIFIHLITPRKVYRRRLLPRRRLIQRHIRGELLLLRRQLCPSSRIPLRHLNLNPQHIRLQLQHLVLDLSILQCLSSGSLGSTCGGDCGVEAAGSDFSLFAEARGGCDDGKVGGGNGGEVGLVDLRLVSRD